MTLAELITGREGTPAEIAEWCNTPSVAKRRSFFLTYRTIGAHIEDEDGLPGYQRLELLAVALASVLPKVDGMLSQYGDNEGSQGGVDMALEGTRSFVQGLVGAGTSQLRQAEADAICALGAYTESPAQDTGLGTIAATDIEIALGTRPRVQQEPSHA